MTDQSRELCELADRLENYLQLSFHSPPGIQEAGQSAARQLRLMAEVVAERDTLRAQVESLEKQCALQSKTIRAFVEAASSLEVFLALGGKATEALKVAGQLAKECESTTAGRDYFRVCPKCGYTKGGDVK
jgi:hypothetical protein